MDRTPESRSARSEAASASMGLHFPRLRLHYKRRAPRLACDVNVIGDSARWGSGRGSGAVLPKSDSRSTEQPVTFRAMKTQRIERIFDEPAPPLFPHDPMDPP